MNKFTQTNKTIAPPTMEAANKYNLYKSNPFTAKLSTLSITFCTKPSIFFELSCLTSTTGIFSKTTFLGFSVFLSSTTSVLSSVILLSSIYSVSNHISGKSQIYLHKPNHNLYTFSYCQHPYNFSHSYNSFTLILFQSLYCFLPAIRI